MKTRYQKYNSKRRVRSKTQIDAETLESMESRVSYGGNPEHKKNPGDFGLTPPSGPRAGKSLCDTAGIFKRELALALLKKGIQKGLISEGEEGEWPKNIWSVTQDGVPMEAQLENPQTGSYHGYPMPESDPLAEEILKRWSSNG